MLELCHEPRGHARLTYCLDKTPLRIPLLSLATGQSRLCIMMSTHSYLLHFHIRQTHRRLLRSGCIQGGHTPSSCRQSLVKNEILAFINSWSLPAGLTLASYCAIAYNKEFFCPTCH
jgi:hypothetical protein